jgi:hypothetical protein
MFSAMFQLNGYQADKRKMARNPFIRLISVELIPVQSQPNSTNHQSLFPNHF